MPAHALLPGLVNAHAHSAMALLRGIADDVALKPWLEQHIWPREGRFVAPDFVHDGTLLAAAEMLRGGITCCNDMYFFPDAAARAYRASGMRAMLGLPVLDFPTPYAADADACLQAGLAARDAWKNEPRLGFSLAPHAPYTVGDDELGQDRDVRAATRPADPDAPSGSAGRARAKPSRSIGFAPLQRLDRLGATGPGFIAIHGVQLDAADIDVARRATLPRRALSDIEPETRQRLRADRRALPGRASTLRLGTDGAASNNRIDVFGEARLAALIAKAATGDAAVAARGDGAAHGDVRWCGRARPGR